MSKPLIRIISAVVFTFCCTSTFAQVPSLGTAANFVLFSTNGSVSNTGASILSGDIGSSTGTVSGFGNVNGVIHRSNDKTSICASELKRAYNELDAASPAFFPAPVLGNGSTLNAGIYSISSDVLLNGSLTLDGQGNGNAVFIFQIEANFSTNAGAQVNLINGAQACNVFWKAEGKVSMATASTMKGTFITNNAAISISAGVSLEGRALSITGAVMVTGISGHNPAGCGSPVISGPLNPPLASATPFALFSGSGEVSNSGNTYVVGDVGSNEGLTTGYDPLQVNGTVHTIPNDTTARCLADLLTIDDYLNTLSHDIELLNPDDFGNKLILTAHTYLLSAAATLKDTLYLDARNNVNAVFVIKVNGAFSTIPKASIVLINGAQAANVFWKVGGALNLSNFSNMTGTFVCNGAINLNKGVTLNGRALTLAGALNTDEITVNVPSDGSIASSTYTWIGGSGDWNNALNWRNDSKTGVPSGCNDNVIILSGSPVVSTSVSAGNVDIASSAHLYITGSLSVCGNFTGGSSAPSITSGPGKIILTGFVAQSISGHTIFSNLELNNSAGASIDTGSTVGITGIYTPAAGTLSTNGGLVLKSSLNGTAFIAKGYGNYITGNATIERYIPSNRSWRLLASPVNANTPQTIKEAWQEGATSSSHDPHPGYGTHITGGTAINGFDQSPTNSSSIKYYGNSWLNLPNTDRTTVAQHSGYFIFVRGSRNYNITGSTVITAPSETTLRVKGELNTGTQTSTFNDLFANQFILIGNPYAAPVDFTGLGKTNIKNTFWAWDAQRSGTSLGGYVTVSWDAVEGAYDIDYSPAQTAQTQIIQSGQAVFVQAQTSGIAASITFNERDKASGITNNVFRGNGSNPSQQLRIVLNRKSGTTSLAVDGVLAKFAEGYSDGNEDNDLKLSNYDENLSIKRNGLKFSIERRPALSPGDTLYLNIDAIKANTQYSFEFNGSNFDDQSYTALIFDKYLNLQTPLSLVETSVISFNTDATARSQDAMRFVVVFKPSSILPITFTGIKAWHTGQAVQVEWNVETETGVSKYTVQKSADLRDFTEVVSIAARNNNKAEIYNQADNTPLVGDNFYRIKIVQNTGAVSYSPVVKVRLTRGAASFSVYPNPVKDSKANLQLINIPEGAYSLAMYDQAGRQILSSRINHHGNLAGHMVLLPASVASGTYYFLLQGIKNNLLSFKQYVLVQ